MMDHHEKKESDKHLAPHTVKTIQLLVPLTQQE